MRGSEVVVAAGLLGAAFLGVFTAGSGGPAGQVVFTQVPALEGSAPDPSQQSLRISDCEETEDGLRVTGHVSPGLAPVQVLVTGGEADQPGVRVGMAFAQDAGVPSGALVGDFSLIVPWATRESRFAVKASGDGRDPADAQPGPVSSCPDADPVGST